MISGDVIEAAGQRLAAAARQPARVLLFGSHARGDAGPHSDLDFLVIERDVPNRHVEMARLARELRSFGVPVDVLDRAVVGVNLQVVRADRHLPRDLARGDLGEGSSRIPVRLGAPTRLTRTPRARDDR